MIKKGFLQGCSQKYRKETLSVIWTQRFSVAKSYHVPDSLLDVLCELPHFAFV